MPPVSETSDLELIGRAQRGRVDAFEQLYDRHAPLMLALGRRMLSSLGDAQDLLQDVFIEAWQDVRGYDPARASVRTWLLVRMRSRALDRRNRSARERNAYDAVRSIGDEQTSHRAEQAFALREALAELDDGVRGALELTYFCGLTAGEISERMQVPEGTVRSRLSRGLHSLERTLSEIEGTHHGS
jgi:RNA polymerase sigma-70 factor (ECF subfamily)